MAFQYDQSARDLEDTVIAGYNSKLSQRVSDLAAKDSSVCIQLTYFSWWASLADNVLPFQIKTFEWDSWTTFTTILDDPASYGFRDNITYGTDADLFWGNDYHPSSKSIRPIAYIIWLTSFRAGYAHDFFGQDVAEVLEGTVW